MLNFPCRALRGPEIQRLVSGTSIHSCLFITSLCEEVTHRHTSVCHEPKQPISMKLVKNVTSLLYKHLQSTTARQTKSTNVWIRLK